MGGYKKVKTNGEICLDRDDQRPSADRKALFSSIFAVRDIILKVFSVVQLKHKTLPVNSAPVLSRKVVLNIHAKNLFDHHTLIPFESTFWQNSFAVLFRPKALFFHYENSQRKWFFIIIIGRTRSYKEKRLPRTSMVNNLIKLFWGTGRYPFY